MQIRSLEMWVVRSPFTFLGDSVGFGGRRWRTIDTLIIKVEDGDGIVGYGEAFGYNVLSATAAMIRHSIWPLLRHREFDSVPQIIRELNQKMHIFGKGGVTQFALAGIDIALWDIFGKRHQMNVSAIWGEESRQRIPCYASLFRYEDLVLLREASHQATESGFRLIKLHERDAEIVVDLVAGDPERVRYALDVNCSWTVDDYRDQLSRLSRLDLAWIEEPVWPPDDIALLRRVRSEAKGFGLAVAGGENALTTSELVSLMRSGAIDIIQPSLTKQGGVTSFLDVVRFAGQYGVPIAPHSPYFGPGLLATAQLLRRTGSSIGLEWLYCEREYDLYPDFVPHEGSIEVPDGIGLGMDPDLGILSDKGELLATLD